MRLALGVLVGAAGLWAMTRRPPSGRNPPQPRYGAYQRGRAATDSDQEARRHQPDRAEEVERQAQDRAAQHKRDEREERHRKREYRYWWVTGGAAVLATVGTLAAAGFAAGAYETARQAHVATTRAYVVLQAETTTDEESKRPVFRFTAENMGQTPVRNLFFVLWDELLDSPWGRPTVRDRVDCARSAGPSSTGLTFGKDALYDMPIYGRLGAPAEWKRTVLVHGTACYRDVHGTAHALPVCFLWHPGGGTRGVQCRYQDD